MQGKRKQRRAVAAVLQQLLPATSDVICIKYQCQLQKQATEGQQRTRTDLALVLQQLLLCSVLREINKQAAVELG